VTSSAMESVKSPFGGLAKQVREVAAVELMAMYRAKCAVDVEPYLAGRSSVLQYQCGATGMKFWRPESLAGDESFYAEVSQRWPNYYKTDRWEYAKAIEVISGAPGDVLEVGCGRGYFLQRVDELGIRAAGLELNREAIAAKVTKADVWNETIEVFRARSSERFSVVCSFQVLEHVVDPAGFIKDCASLLKPGGYLIFSTPNHDFAAHASDPFDMPPHHMNHFTAESFKKIGEVLGLAVSAIEVQTRSRPRFAVWSNRSGNLVNRVLREALNRTARLVAGTVPAPGENLVCVYQLPTDRGTY
jgi:SAM-dependent methyltransferase